MSTPDLRERLRANLAAFDCVSVTDPALVRAAVAVTVVPARGGRGVLLTRRAARLRRHAGQWALPGGRLDPGEDATAAALRELDEELGLRLQAADVLGRLDDYPTRSGYVITPVVVWARDRTPLTANPAEVASVHRVPLDQLVAEPLVVHEPDNPDPVLRLRLIGRYIHAPTAAVLHQFGEVALAGRPTRVAHYGQPRFAWR